MEGRGGCRQTPVWSPANTRIWPDAVSILAHRQRPWANIETTLGQVLLFPERPVCIWIHACRLCLVGTDCTVLCVPSFHKDVYLSKTAASSRMRSCLSTTHWTNVNWTLGHRLQRWPLSRPELPLSQTNPTRWQIACRSPSVDLSCRYSFKHSVMRDTL